MKLTEEQLTEALLHFWAGRAKMEPLGYVGFIASDHHGISAKAVAQIDRWRARGRKESVRLREATVKTALQLIDHPIFKWCVISRGDIKAYKKRSNVAAKAAGLIAHDRVLLNTGPSLPSHYGTTITVYTACLNSAIMTPNI